MLIINDKALHSVHNMHYAMMELTSQLDCMITRVRLSPPASRGFTRIGLASTQRPWTGRSYMYFNVEWIVKFSMGSVHMWWGSEIDRLIEIRFPVEIWMSICKMWRVLRSRLYAKWIFKLQCPLCKRPANSISLKHLQKKLSYRRILFTKFHNQTILLLICKHIKRIQIVVCN